MFSYNTYAQTSKKLIGTWKVVGMSDDEMYWDLRTDSFSLKEAVDTDSANRELVKELFSKMGKLYSFLVAMVSILISMMEN